jgi:hypothetical protein
MNRAIKTISNIVYAIGVAIVLSLSAIALFGSNEIINPDAMLPISWREQAFMWLVFGTIPMLLACMAVYKFNDIKNSSHRKRGFILIFLSGFICSACALYVIGQLAVGMINTLIFTGE